jgi:hypothetical protein
MKMNHGGTENPEEALWKTKLGALRVAAVNDFRRVESKDLRFVSEAFVLRAKRAM